MLEVGDLVTVTDNSYGMEWDPSSVKLLPSGDLRGRTFRIVARGNDYPTNLHEWSKYAPKNDVALSDSARPGFLVFSQLRFCVANTPPAPPEPRDWWLNVYPDSRAAHTSKEVADKSADGNRIECVHVREVIE